MADRNPMVWLFEPDETLVAVLSNTNPEACPFWDDLLFENLRGASSYEFVASADHEDSKFLVNENLVLIKNIDGENMLFRIKYVDEAHADGKIVKKVVAEAAMQELNGSIVRPQTFIGQPIATIMNYILGGTRWDVGVIEWDGILSISWPDYPTVLKAVLDVFNASSLEVRYRVTFNGNRITGRYIDMLEQRGSYTGKVFEYTKDVVGLSRSGDSTALATAVIGLGKADENGNFVTFNDIDTPAKPAEQDWVGDDEAKERFGLVQSDGSRAHIFAVFQDQDETDPMALLTKAQAYLAIVKEPAFSYNIDVTLLEGLPQQAMRLRKNWLYNSTMTDANADGALDSEFTVANYPNVTWTITKLEETEWGTAWQVRSTRTLADGLASYPSIRPSQSRAAAPGQVWTGSIMARNRGASGTSASVSIVKLAFYDANLAILSQPGLAMVDLGSEWKKYTLSAEAPAGTAKVQIFFPMISHSTVGAHGDYAQVDIAGPQLEKEVFASDFIATTSVDLPLVPEVEDEDFEHERVRIGDTVIVKDMTFDPPLVISVRVLELRRSATNPSTDQFSHRV